VTSPVAEPWIGAPGRRETRERRCDRYRDRVPEVTCPACQIRQEVGDPDGYTCVSCGTTWVFATCENCAVRFHMRPGTTAWTCPECGHENGAAVMVDLGADTEPAPERGLEADPEPQLESEPASFSDVTGATTGAAPRHAASASPPNRSSGPPTRARLATIAAIGIAAVLVIAFALSALGGDGTETAAGSGTPAAPTSSPAPSSSLTTTETLCLHLRDLQLLRVDNYTRVAGELANDEAAIQAAGDVQLAAAVAKMRTAVLAYRDALAAQTDMTAVTQQMGKASAKMPCG
jgi:transcription elongation factor Elf1